MKNINRFRAIFLLLMTSMIIGLCGSSCSLEKKVSLTTGRYESSYYRYNTPNIKIETARDTIASYRF